MARPPPAACRRRSARSGSRSRRRATPLRPAPPAPPPPRSRRPSRAGRRPRRAPRRRRRRASAARRPSTAPRPARGARPARIRTWTAAGSSKLRRGRLEPEARLDLHGMTSGARPRGADRLHPRRPRRAACGWCSSSPARAGAGRRRVPAAAPRHPAPQPAALARGAAARRPHPAGRAGASAARRRRRVLRLSAPAALSRGLARTAKLPAQYADRRDSGTCTLVAFAQPRRAGARSQRSPRVRASCRSKFG